MTFRSFSIPQIVDIAIRAGVEGIEWGGDVHVPPGDWHSADEAVVSCRENGLKIASYGSYYRLGQPKPSDYDEVLDTCLRLGAPNLRVWAGDVASEDAHPAYRLRVEMDASRCARLAASVGVTLSLEYHAGTLTDTAASALDLICKAGSENLKSYWQVKPEKNQSGNLEDIATLTGHLSNLHCHHIQDGKRLPLADGRGDWIAYLAAAAVAGLDRWVLIEFVAGDSPQAFSKDASELRDWLEQLGGS